MTDKTIEFAAMPQLLSTEAMRQRAKELATPPRDDFDRAVLIIIDHVERLEWERQHSRSVEIILTGKDHGVCVGGRFHGWKMWRHPDGQWVTIQKLESEIPNPAVC